MEVDDSNKNKRNKPCENCRAHRRKCIVLQGMQCERCIKMATPCIFKFIAKPNTVKKSVPAAKRNRLLAQVRLMEEQVEAMEEQLMALHVGQQQQQQQQQRQQPLYYGPQEPPMYIKEEQIDDNNNSNDNDNDYEDEDEDEDDEQQYETVMMQQRKRRRPDNNFESSNNKEMISPEHAQQWQLTVSRGRAGGLQLSTSIQNMEDMQMFLYDALGYFRDSSPTRPPLYHVDRRVNSLTVTNKILRIEEIIRNFFASQTSQQPQKDAPTPLLLDPCESHLRQHLIDAYFTCNGSLYPTLVRPYFHPYLRANPDCMLACAMCAFVAYSSCQHANLSTLTTMPRRELAESCRRRARSLLQDELFESEPTVETVATLMFLTQTSLILLRNSEGRTYISMAWRIATQLRDHYLEQLHNVNPGSAPPEAESWRRLFYMVRYLEVNMHIIYDGRASISPVLLHEDIGYPVVLDCEKDDPELSSAVQVFYHIIRLNDCHLSTKVDEIGYRLLAGSLETVLCSDIEYLENQMFGFWQSLPPKYRLSDSPMDYVQLDRVQQCTDPHVLYLNKLYYSYWLALETRVMQAPSQTNLVGASFSRLDGERALVIVSICSDAVAKIFRFLHWRLPCVIELHWILITSDAMKMLRDAANPQIRERAKKNLRCALKVLKEQLQSNQGASNVDLAAFGFDNNSLSGSTSSTTTSSSSGASSCCSIPLEDAVSERTSPSSFEDDKSPFTPPNPQLQQQSQHSVHHNHHHSHHPIHHQTSPQPSSSSSSVTTHGAYFRAVSLALESYFGDAQQ
ncbi:hypothetical protein BCR43DRAFT_326194 [Syncephalastrum racemosum]|uniref:Zn(2)-C6 fungal-type domain-containing protein n=1 Tax=Syncephalastrum racemosum TaxID=13706 RepID=A0A1X2H7Q9_SYNRA|nr:hypothetical protein BCR43DRAFT_326194 [Syncephalastrum racemosum]